MMSNYFLLTCILAAHVFFVSGWNYKPLDVVFVMDRTRSAKYYAYDTTWTDVHRKDIIFEIRKNFPNSRFGSFSYGDKKAPCYRNLEWDAKWAPENWCTRFTRELSSVNLDELQDILKNDFGPNDFLRNIPSREDSLDLRSDVLSAMMVAAKEPRMGWSDGVDRQKVMIVMGQRFGHYAGDVLCDREKYHPNDGDSQYDCDHEDYPTEKQVVDALRDANIATVVIQFDVDDHTSQWQDFQRKIGTPWWHTILVKFQYVAFIAKLRSFTRIN